MLRLYITSKSWYWLTGRNVSPQWACSDFTSPHKADIDWQVIYRKASKDQFYSMKYTICTQWKWLSKYIEYDWQVLFILMTRNGFFQNSNFTCSVYRAKTKWLRPVGEKKWSKSWNCDGVCNFYVFAFIFFIYSR